MSHITVKLFAAAKEAVGCDELKIGLNADATVADLKQLLADNYPQLKTVLQHAAFAIDTEYATPETTVPDGAEVACIPPVSGG